MLLMLVASINDDIVEEMKLLYVHKNHLTVSSCDISVRIYCPHSQYILVFKSIMLFKLLNKRCTS